MMQGFSFKTSSIKQITTVLQSHINSMAYPWDSYLEENLEKSEITAIYNESNLIGYAGVHEEKIAYFHITMTYFNLAPQAFEAFKIYCGLNKAYMLTHDPLLASVVAEWDYTKQKEACWFYDAGRLPKPNTLVKDATFRLASLSDADDIETIIGDFFDPLQKRIKQNTIYILQKDNDMLGYGVIEHSHYFSSCSSIGMIVDKRHRKKGVAQTVLWHLKEVLYAQGKTPIAGCWYYNILSRKSLERAGLRAVAKGYIITLNGKEVPPLRTGNPPGELVE